MTSTKVCDCILRDCARLGRRPGLHSAGDGTDGLLTARWRAEKLTEFVQAGHEEWAARGGRWTRRRVPRAATGTRDIDSALVAARHQVSGTRRADKTPLTG